MKEITYGSDIEKYSMYSGRRAAWIEALRSGAFEQTTGRLVSARPGAEPGELAYCCLGVACTIFSSVSNYTVKNSSYFQNERTGAVASLILPEILRQYLGLSVADQKVLSTLNDNGATFELIAYAIDAMAIFEE